ncbi:hypothetical protein LT493_32545 [Streptomyces tricolor]|nr:hypothetical protein [Streptomyces tricolor]
MLSRVKPESAGVASGVLSTAQQCGGAFGVAVIGAIFFSSFHPAEDGRVAAAGHALRRRVVRGAGLRRHRGHRGLPAAEAARDPELTARRTRRVRGRAADAPAIATSGQVDCPDVR